ncbi:MAG: hypothetical protein H6834_06590 [Planctomycetes bacterium]|nr:hypothetical protein [Planctomycetota bacterium]MCB9891815.1 hypothetical protein [Planctomycetota bacterium]
MRSIRLALTTLALVSVPHSLPAQSLLGLDAGSALAPPRSHEFGYDCSRINACFPNPGGSPFPVINPVGGGIAYGFCRKNVWVTDGLVLHLMDQNCNPIFTCPTGAPAADPWTGLAVDEENGRMFYTQGSLIVERPIANICPLPPPTNRCQVTAPFAPPLTGVEYDATTRTFWVCDSQGNVGNVAFSPSGVCTVLRFFQAICAGGAVAAPLQGITIDMCERIPGANAPGMITVTDHRGNIIHMDTFGTPYRCCSYAPALGRALRLVGLARKPIQPRTFGAGCTDSTCSAACSPTIGTQGEAVIPSNCFGITLNGAPGGSTAFLFLDVAPLGLPFACGMLQVAPGIVIPTGPTGGVPGMCNGSAFVPLAIPNDPNLCGGALFFQWVMVCNPATFGLALSDAIQVIID